MIYKVEPGQRPTEGDCLGYLVALDLESSDVNSYSGSGTSWLDLTGLNNVSLNNGVGFVADADGSLVFDGVNDFGITNNNLS